MCRSAFATLGGGAWDFQLSLALLSFSIRLLLRFTLVRDPRFHNSLFPNSSTQKQTWNGFDPETGHEYNNCQFFSNLEINDLRFFRSKENEKYFDWLDKAWWLPL
jgi:hypothetical protein